MELMTIWTWVFGGSSLLNIIGAIFFFKSKKKVENLTANAKDVEVAKDAIALVAEVQNQLKESIQNDSKLRAQISKYQIRLNSQGRSISEMRSSMITLAEIIETQTGRKMYAESNICTMFECDLRTPPRGTYRSSNDTKVVENLITKLNKGLKEETVNVTEVANEQSNNN